jgi:4-hydroxy-tetrahydrodipicolinate reductase
MASFFYLVTMKIALIGYGKMGRTIEALGIQQGHSFPLIIDKDKLNEFTVQNFSGIDVAIEFSNPEAASGNIKKCFDFGVPVVSGTTGWNDKIPEIKAYCIEKRASFFFASNFSIGVNILFALNRKLAKIMELFPDYTVSMSEAHHVHKLDAPSGTALSLAEQILENNRNISSDQLPIKSIREGEIKGKHSVQYDSEMDSITLSHDAKTRDAFASGALLAAAFILNKEGVFGMQDLLKL